DGIKDIGGWIGDSKTGWISYEFPKEVQVSKYNIYPQGVLTRSPASWTFDGSNNGVDWIPLDTRENITDWVASTPKSYEITNNKKFKFYRLNITKNNGHASTTGVIELEMFELIVVRNLILKNPT